LKFVSLQGNKRVEPRTPRVIIDDFNLYPKSILCRPNYATCHYVSLLNETRHDRMPYISNHTNLYFKFWI